jgi:hypothetical protein
MRNLLILAALAGAGLPALAGDCRSVVQSLPQAASYSYSQATYVQQTPVIQQAAPVYDVAPAPCTCQTATAALPSYTLPVQTTAAVYAMPSYYLPSAATVSYRSYAAALPQTYISRSFATPVYHSSAAFGTGYVQSAPVRFLGPPIRSAPAFNPGGFRAGFSGQGLNNSGAGFLTGGGLIGGAANALGVSSAGLEGAALGILATRSNLFGLAPRRR